MVILLSYLLYILVGSYGVCSLTRSLVSTIFTFRWIKKNVKVQTTAKINSHVVMTLNGVWTPAAEFAFHIEYHQNVPLLPGPRIFMIISLINAPLLIFFRYLDPTALNKNFKMKRIYLIWVCRDIREFTWFLQLMNDTIKHVSLYCFTIKSCTWRMKGFRWKYKRNNSSSSTYLLLIKSTTIYIRNDAK